MTRTTYYTAATLDGYLADEQDSLDWLFVQESDEAGPMGYAAFVAGIGALAMGRTTYDWILRHQAETGEPWAYEMPAWVFTHAEPEPLAGADVRFVSGDVAPVHAAMMRAAGDLGVWVVGGGDLAAQFAEAGLLDELVVSIAPVTLGAGRPPFPRPFDLRLTELVRNGAFACARYEVLAPR
ncbi:MAG: dihydrofolate reductase family protein [Nocardioides sp.]|nr:dihydrofolate reductase family protein [Nocardioides sp.]